MCNKAEKLLIKIKIENKFFREEGRKGKGNL